MKTRMGTRAATLLTAVLLGACGGGSPSGPPIPTPLPPPSVAPPAPSPTPVPTSTITINASGQVTPADIQVPRGTRVTFANQHASPHDMTSNPHPTHTDCPEINQVGNLFNGQSGRTAPLDTVRRCGFHDHGEPDNGRLQGSITVQ